MDSVTPPGHHTVIRSLKVCHAIQIKVFRRMKSVGVV